MKARLVAICAVLTLGATSLTAQERIPTIVFESLVKDFGKVTEGETLKYTFKFANKGQATLEILKVEPG